MPTIRELITLVEAIEPDFFTVGRPVADPAKINDDCNDILEPEEWDWEWRLCRAPIELIDYLDPGFHDEERMVRLRPQDEHAPIILALKPNGRLELLDGGHRIKVAVERGQRKIAALIGRNSQ